MKGAELKLTYTPGIGEIYRHALISEDHTTRIFFSIVPAPMVEQDKTCSLEIVRLSPRFELALIRGKGFTPGELISFHTQSYQEAHDSQTKSKSTRRVLGNALTVCKRPDNGNNAGHGKKQELRSHALIRMGIGINDRQNFEYLRTRLKDR